jgi:hypothetical protein
MTMWWNIGLGVFGTVMAAIGYFEGHSVLAGVFAIAIAAATVWAVVKGKRRRDE